MYLIIFAVIGLLISAFPINIQSNLSEVAKTKTLSYRGLDNRQTPEGDQFLREFSEFSIEFLEKRNQALQTSQVDIPKKQNLYYTIMYSYNYTLI